MRNEMGNNNVSGLKAAEEENSAVEVRERAQEDAHADEVQGENHIIPEADTKNFHAKVAESSSKDQSDAKEFQIDRHESNGTDEENKEPERQSQIQETSTESNNLVSQETNIQKAASPDTAKDEKPVEPKLEDNMSFSGSLQIGDPSSIERETGTMEVKSSNSSDSNITTQHSATANGTTTIPEHNICLFSDKSEDVQTMSQSCNTEEKENLEEQIGREENIDNMVAEESHSLGDKLLEVNNSMENCDTKITEDKIGDGLGSHGNFGVPLRANLSSFSYSPTEAVPEGRSLAPFVAIPETQENCLIHAEEINLKSSKSEVENSQQDLNVSDSIQQTGNQSMINNSAPSVTLHETHSNENGQEKLSSGPILEKVYHVEKVKVIHKRSRRALADNKNSLPFEQFKNTEEVMKILPTVESVSIELSSTATCDEEERASGNIIVEETVKREDVPSSREVSSQARGTREECLSISVSFDSENSLAASSTPPFNSQLGNESLLGSETAEEENRFPMDVKEHGSSEIFVTATPTINADHTITQTPVMNGQITTETLLDTQLLSMLSNQQYPTAETSPWQNCKARESAARLSIESNPEQPVNRMHVRKSPSFDFGIPLDARSEESDQTPLLHHDKTAAKIFSGCANVRFQNKIAQNDFGRNSLDFEPVAVEEKTIRVERSDSDISRAEFMSLLKKDEKASAESIPQEQECQAADTKAVELPADEFALTSLKGRGKRKPRASLFTACICCAASIH